MKKITFVPYLISIVITTTVLLVDFGTFSRADTSTKAGTETIETTKTNISDSTNTPANSVSPQGGSTAAAEAAKPKSGGASITITDDDDDDSTDKDGKHTGNIYIGGHHHDGGAWSDLESDVVPVLGILGSFGTPILIVFFVCYFNYRRRQENLALARDYLNKGLPVPPELIDPSGSSTTPSGARTKSDLQKGIRLAFIGLGISLAFYFFSPESKNWAWGLIPLVMGLGYVVAALAENRQGMPPRDRP